MSVFTALTWWAWECYLYSTWRGPPLTAWGSLVRTQLTQITSMCDVHVCVYVLCTCTYYQRKRVFFDMENFRQIKICSVVEKLIFVCAQFNIRKYFPQTCACACASNRVSSINVCVNMETIVVFVNATSTRMYRTLQLVKNWRANF